MVNFDLGLVYRAAGDGGATLQVLDRACTLMEELVQANPAVSDYQLGGGDQRSGYVSDRHEQAPNSGGPGGVSHPF
jgi:hypothetical protein